MQILNKLSWSATASLGGAIFDIIKLSMLAHYLPPADFGIFAIATVVLGFCQLFSESGIGNALISRESVSKHLAGQTINVSIIITLFVYLLAVIISPTIANFYSMPELSSLIPLLLLALPFIAISTILQALLLKNLHFNITAKATLLSKLIGFIFTWLAINKISGIYLLAYSTLISSLFYLLLLIKPSQKYVMLTKKICYSDIKPILSFSKYQLGEFLLSFMSKNFDVILITKFLGSEVSGVYTVSKNLLIKAGEIIFSTFSRFFYPVLSKKSQLKSNFIACYLNYFNIMIVISFSSYLIIALNSQLFVQFLLGSNFIAVIELFPFMCFWLAFRFSTAPVSTLWLARSQPSIGVYWNIINFFVIPVSLYLSYSHGLRGILWALIVSQLFFLLCSFFLAFKLTWNSIDLLKKQIKMAIILPLLCIIIYFTTGELSAFTADKTNFLNLLFSLIYISFLSIFLIKKKESFIGNIK